MKKSLKLNLLCLLYFTLSYIIYFIILGIIASSALSVSSDDGITVFLSILFITIGLIFQSASIVTLFRAKKLRVEEIFLGEDNFETKLGWYINLILSFILFISILIHIFFIFTI